MKPDPVPPPVLTHPVLTAEQARMFNELLAEIERAREASDGNRTEPLRP